MDSSTSHRVGDAGSPTEGHASKDEPAEVEASAKSAPKKDSFLKSIWIKLGLNFRMLTIMAKAGVPPVISLAIYQSTRVAQTYSTIGYLIAIMSLLSFAIFPRAKFIQTMILNIIGVCLGAAVALLGVYSGVQARLHTQQVPHSAGGSAPDVSRAPYNSSQSAISAIWLFASIYAASSFRASFPQLQFPVIIYSIFANVAFTYAPQFATMQQGIAFVELLLKAFLTGFAIATGVSLFLYPILTTRDSVFLGITRFTRTLQGAIKAQAAYLESLEKSDAFGAPDKNKDLLHKLPPEAQKLKAATKGLGEIYGKLHGDLTFAKREIAYGKLDAKDLDDIVHRLRDILLPMLGMSSIVDIFERISKARGWKSAEQSESKEKEMLQWNELMKTLHGPFDIMTKAMCEGLEHSLYELELAKPPKQSRTPQGEKPANPHSDVEADGGIVRPGDPTFAAYLAQKIHDFHERRKVTLKMWCAQHNIEVPVNGFEGPPVEARASAANGEDTEQAEIERQLYLILHLEFLLWSAGQAVLDYVKCVDSKVQSGRNKNRWIFPGMKRIRTWIMRTFQPEDTTTETMPDTQEISAIIINLGESYNSRKDPEHLPPTNAWQRFGNVIRGISHFLASPASVYGFRAACATLSIGIVAYLESTQVFFVKQRLVWAMIMVSISMTTTAGFGVFGFLARCAGTTIAMCVSLIIYYIAGGNGTPAGVLVLIWFAISLEFYVVLKYPQFTVVAVICTVTQTLILGYELQVRKVGVATATSNGQPYYPIYELAPYRLACVAGGCFLAFVFTFFPYPITERSQIRKDLGASLFLLANFYSCVHTTVGMRIQGREALDVKGSPGRKLDKVRHKVMIKELSLIASLRQHSTWTVWEPTLGGKFPKEVYDEIISEVASLLNYMALMSFATRTFSTAREAPEEKTWLNDFARLIESVNHTADEIVSMLSLLSASVINGSPLPPYLVAPSSFQLSKQLKAIDADILSISHIAEPGYSAFAVVQVASKLINDDLEKLIANVKSLVGVVDFSFHVVSTTGSSNESLAAKGKND